MDTNPNQGSPPPSPMEEKTLWDGSPSQIINLPVFLVCALAIGALLGAAFYFRDKGTATVAVLGGLAAVPFLIAVFRWMRTRACRYHLTSERLQMTTGILSRKTEDLELYRVKDYHLIEPFSMRMFGLADVVLNTNDDANPTVVLKAISGGGGLRDEIRKNVEICRDRKRVRITELES